MRNTVSVLCQALDAEGLWGGVLLCLAFARPVLSFLKRRSLLAGVAFRKYALQRRPRGQLPFPPQMMNWVTDNPDLNFDWW